MGEEKQRNPENKTMQKKHQIYNRYKISTFPAVVFGIFARFAYLKKENIKKVVNNITLVDVLGELGILSNTLQNNKFHYYNWLSV